MSQLYYIHFYLGSHKLLSSSLISDIFIYDKIILLICKLIFTNKIFINILCIYFYSKYNNKLIKL